MKFFLKIILATSLFALLFSCNQSNIEKQKISENLQSDSVCIETETKQINSMLDSFNLAAANANFDQYFSYYADNAVFIGTDPTENWIKQDFMIWAKPFFDKGKAWNFKSLERNIYFDQTGKLAWFDELLDTQMKICRGSGVLTKQGNEWKIQQYVLSMTIPNSLTDSVVSLKATIEDEMIMELRHK
jgi:hypothetical protein